MDELTGVHQSGFATVLSLTKPYFDSSVFIAHIRGETISCPDGSTRVETTTHLFEDAKGRKLTIFTSTVTIAEVRRMRHKKEPITDKEIAHINTFFAEFLEHEWMYPIEVTREIAEKAQRLGAQYGIDAMDSIHLASAIWNKCTVLFVWDKSTFMSRLPTEVEGVQIMQPHWEGIVKMPVKQRATTEKKLGMF